MAILFPVIGALTAFLLVLILTPLARLQALKVGFLDHPGGRKKHEDSVPPVGGLVVFPVFMAAAAFALGNWQDYFWLYVALGVILVTGVLDDRTEVPPRIKFAMQCLAALLIVIPGHARIIGMGDLFGYGPVGLGPFSIPFSLTATVLLINAVNLMDGLDGLAGGMGFIILGWMAACAAVFGSQGETAELLILCGALAGFLAFNLRHPWRKRASVFLGDAGSLALGLVIAWYAIRLGGKPAHPVMPPSAVAWLLALPIMDTCGQFARRVREGRHPFDADHDHFHHHIVRAGVPVARATALILGLIFFCGAIGLAGLWIGIPSWAMMYLWAALLLTHIYLSMHPKRFRRLIYRLLTGKAEAA